MKARYETKAARDDKVLARAKESTLEISIRSIIGGIIAAVCFEVVKFIFEFRAYEFQWGSALFVFLVISIGFAVYDFLQRAIARKFEP